jgi:hypothetical protein
MWRERRDRSFEKMQSFVRETSVPRMMPWNCWGRPFGIVYDGLSLWSLFNSSGRRSLSAATVRMRCCFGAGEPPPETCREVIESATPHALGCNVQSTVVLRPVNAGHQNQ